MSLSDPRLVIGQLVKYSALIGQTPGQAAPNYVSMLEL